MPADDTTAIFQRSWNVYDFITERNYMFHREIYAEVARLLQQRAHTGAYRMLDLGCGNARFLAPCLEAAPPIAYTGIDLSETALAEARTWLPVLPEVKLVQQDLLEAVEAAGDPCDVVFSGFALHHLDSDAKQRFFRATARRLTPGGWFLFVDIIREEDQSRAAYLHSYIGFMAANWTELPADHLAAARAHIEAYDYPETVPTLEAMARAAGFHAVEPISRHGHHQVMLFTRF
jgi:SAM-dependent methyltransferase